MCKLVSKVLLDREFIAKHLTAEQCRPRKVLYWAIYGLAAGDTEMTNWRIVKKGEGDAPTLVKPVKTYVHSPKRDRLTKLVRIEGRNLDCVQRSNIKAA